MLRREPRGAGPGRPVAPFLPLLLLVLLLSGLGPGASVPGRAEAAPGAEARDADEGEIRLVLDPASAVEVVVRYDPDALDVVGADSASWEGTMHEPLVWCDDDGAGTATVAAVASHRPLTEVSLHFVPDDPEAPPPAVSPSMATVVRAFDVDGVPLPPGTVRVRRAEIR